MKRRSLRTSFLSMCITGLLIAGSSANAAFPGANGGFIAYSVFIDGESNIAVMGIDGSKPTQLTSNGRNDYYPSFSPDGTKIVFQSQDGANTNLYLINTDGSGETRITSDAAPETFPSWSPDGSMIVFEKKIKGNADIYAMKAEAGAQAIRLTTDRGTDIRPAWSPDGTKIAFMSDRDGDYEVFVLTIDPVTLAPVATTQLTQNKVDDGSPDWSPSGTHITYTSCEVTRQRNGCVGDIYVMQADGEAKNRLTTDAANDSSPDWSPDGTFILFSSDRNGNSDIFRMTPAGETAGPPSAVTSTPQNEFSPDWQSSNSDPNLLPLG